MIGRRTELSIQHFDPKMAQQKDLEIELKEGRADKAFEGIFHYGDKLWMYSSFTNNKTDKKMLFAQEVNKKTLRPSSQTYKLMEIGGKETKLSSSDFTMRLSADSSHIAVLANYVLRRSKKDSDKKIELQVYDSEMNLKWDRKVVLPWSDYLFDVERIRVNNKGEVYVMGIRYKGIRKSKRKGDPNYEYRILKYSDGDSSPEEYEIDLDDKFITDCTLALLPNGNLITSGFYSSRGSFSIDGTFFVTINGKSKLIENRATKEFSLDFITMNMTDRQAKKAEKKQSKGKDQELYEYDLDNIIIREDGGALLVGEQYYMYVTQTTTTSANGGTQTTTTYHYVYNDIIVVNLSPEGIIEWATKIPKRQHTTNDGGFYSSYVLSVVGDKMYFVFNDNPKNLLERDEGKYKNFKPGRESMVVLVELNGAGESNKAALFSSKEADVICRPKVSEQVNARELVIYGQKKRTHRLFRMEFGG
jgi:hypothetical protein